MHLFICLSSLLLTFHLSLLRASNYTIQNVQETNFSQSISYDDIFENSTSLGAVAEEPVNRTKELDSTARIVASTTEVDPVKSLTTSTQQNFTITAQNLTTENASPPSFDTTSHLSENLPTTYPVSNNTTESEDGTSSTSYGVSDAKSQQSVTESETAKIEIQVSTGKSSTTISPTTKASISTVKTFTTSVPVPATEVNVATLEYESDKNHDELILSGIFEDSHDDDDFKHSFDDDDGGDKGIGYVTPTYADSTPAVLETASIPSVTPDNITSFEETVEHNAIHTTDFEGTTDKSQIIVVGHKCTRIFQESILWNVTDGGMLALKSCPSGYQGNMYRPCFSNGKWGNVDYSECRLEHLGRMRHMVSNVPCSI